MSQLSSKVWSIADKLRGPYKSNEYGEVILPFTVLRRLECVIQPFRAEMEQALAEASSDAAIRGRLRALTRTDESPGLTFYNTSPWTLASIFGQGGDMATNLVEYVHKFSPNIDVFAYFDFDNIVRKLADNNRLSIIIKEFADEDFSPRRISNAAMGDLFENLIYRFAEGRNDKAGEFYTPRDAIRLLVDLVFAGDSDTLRDRGAIRRIYDPAAGTGGMLTVAEERLKELNPSSRPLLFAQEFNPQTYAICKSDLLIQGQDVDNIRFGDTLIEDKFADRKFDFILSNPPFGQDWKVEEEHVRAEHHKGAAGRFAAGLPAIDDGALLFLMHVVAKLSRKNGSGSGGRAGVVLNGSALFTDGPTSGTSKARKGGASEIRGWLLENDLVDAIIGLPTNMFYNTGIPTYLWILDTNKVDERRGRVQLIDATKAGTPMRKPLGMKNTELSPEDRRAIVEAYGAFLTTEDDVAAIRSQIIDNLNFAYWQVSIDRPLRLNFQCSPERIDRACTAAPLAKPKFAELRTALEAFGDAVHKNRDEFDSALGPVLASHDITTTTAERARLLKELGEDDDSADVCRVMSGKDRGKAEAAPRPDTEIVPFGWGGFPATHEARDETVRAYFEKEVSPWVDGAWYDTEKIKVGYEIPFTRQFYVYKPPRSVAEIDKELEAKVAELAALLKAVEAND